MRLRALLFQGDSLPWLPTERIVIPTVYHVLPARGHWVITRGTTQEVIARRRQKVAAMARGWALAMIDRPSRLFIHRADGTMEYERTFSRDPRPPGV